MLLPPAEIRGDGLSSKYKLFVTLHTFTILGLFPETSHLHRNDEAGQVVSCFPRVGHGDDVIEVGCPLVPVHHDDVHVLLLGQQVDYVVYPQRGRSSGPVAVDDKGGRA